MTEDELIERDEGCTCPVGEENHCYECGACIELCQFAGGLCYQCRLDTDVDEERAQ